MGHANFKTTAVWRQSRAIGGQGIEESLAEIAAVYRGGQVADGGVGDGGHCHGREGELVAMGRVDLGRGLRRSVGGFNHIEKQSHSHGWSHDSYKGNKHRGHPGSDEFSGHGDAKRCLITV